jgi:PAS domain S-box-containing protein
MVICAVPGAGLAVYAYRNLSKPGARGFLLCLVGEVGWSVMLATITWPDPILPVHVNTALRVVFQLLVIFGWPLLVWEYTRRDRVTLWPRYVAALLVVPVITVLLTLTNPLHHLVIAAESPPDPTGISGLVLGPWYLVHIAFAVTLVMLPVGVLLSDLRSAHGDHRRQLLLLLAGWAVGFPGGLQTHLFRTIDSIPLYVDLTPITFIVATALWGVALYRYQLFGMVPVSRRTAVETMADPVVSVDTEGTVVDCNPAARRLFEIEGDPIGRGLDEFCRAHPEIHSLYESGGKRTSEVSLDADGTVRYFSLHVRPIEEGATVTGSLIVLREITKLRERERELDLLKQVFGRVFRHNVRNELTVLRGQADVIDASDEADAFVEQTDRIVDSADRLLAHTEKAISLRKVIDVETTTERMNLESVADEQVRSCRRTYPEVHLEADLDEVYVESIPAVGKAVAEVIENSILHYSGEAGDVRIRLTARQNESTGALVIADNGPGIDPYEVANLGENEESALEHGSGVGLWMVRLILQKCDGSFAIDAESELGGTRVELTFPLAARAEDDPTVETAGSD